MDLFYDIIWSEAHPFEKALHTKLRGTRNSWDWNILYYHLDNGKWLCLTRGTFGNPDGFYLAYGPKKEELLDIFGKTHEWFVENMNLTNLVKRAFEDWGIDLSSLPLEQWEVLQSICVE